MWQYLILESQDKFFGGKVILKVDFKVFLNREGRNSIYVKGIVCVRIWRYEFECYIWEICRSLELLDFKLYVQENEVGEIGGR